MLSKVPTNSAHYNQQKPPLIINTGGQTEMPPPVHPASQNHPSSAPANRTTFSPNDSFSSNAATPPAGPNTGVLPSKPPTWARAANMVKHRHIAKKKGYAEKFNQSVKEAIRREQMQPSEASSTAASVALSSSGSAGDSHVGGNEMQLDHPDAEKATPIIPLPAPPRPHTAPPPATRPPPEVIVILDSDEDDDLQYPPDSPFSEPAPGPLIQSDPASEPEEHPPIQTEPKDESASASEAVSPSFGSPVLLQQPLSEKAKGKQRAVEPVDDADDDADDEADIRDAEHGFPHHASSEEGEVLPSITYLPNHEPSEDGEISSDEEEGEVMVKPGAGSKKRMVIDDDDDEEEQSFEAAREARKALQQDIFGDADSDSELSDERPVELHDTPEKTPKKRVFVPQSDDEDDQPATKKFAASASGSGTSTKLKSSTSLWKARQSSVIDLSSGDEDGTSKPRPRPRPRPRPMATGDERPSTSQQKPKKAQQVLNIEASIDAYLKIWQVQIRKLHKDRKEIPADELNAKMAELLEKIKERQYWLLLEHISRIKLPSLLRKIGDSYSEEVRNEAERILDCFEQRFHSNSLYIWDGVNPIARKHQEKKKK